MLMNYAAKFGQTVDQGMRGTPQAFPYIYNLIDSSQDDWEQVKGTVPYGTLAGIGPLIPAGGNVRRSVVLDSDYNFKLLYVKHNAYKYTDINPAGPPVMAYAWHTPDPGLWVDPVNELYSIHDRLVRHVRVNVSFQSNAQMLYGAPWNTQSPAQPLSANRDPLPLSADGISGGEYYITVVRTPMLLPANGSIIYDIYNDNDVPVVVGITAHGMKVRL